MAGFKAFDNDIISLFVVRQNKLNKPLRTIVRRLKLGYNSTVEIQ
jgi:hypothetical protein